MARLDATTLSHPGRPKAYLRLEEPHGRLVCLDVRVCRARDSISRRANGLPAPWRKSPGGTAW